MPYRSIVTKIIAIFFIIGILPMLFFNLLYYTDYQTINDRIFESNMTKITSEKSKVLSLTLSQVETSVKNLSQWVEHTYSDLEKHEISTSFEVGLPPGNNSIYIPDTSDISKEVQFDINLSNELYPNLVNAYENSNQQGWIYVITKNDLLTIYPNTNLESFGANHKFENDIYYYIANPSNNPGRETVWTAPYYDWLGQGWMITCTSPVYINDQFYGIAAIDITLEDIQILVKDEFFDNLGYSFLINKKADIIYHPLAEMNQPEAGMTYYENALSENFNQEFHDVIRKMLISPLGSTYYYDKKTNNSKFVVYKEVEGTDFILGIESKINTNVLSDSTYGRYILSISVPLIILMTAIGIYLFRRISSPIQKLADAASNYEIGNVPILDKFEAASSDEIGVLQESFKKMLSTIHRNTKELIQKNNEMTSVFNSFPGVLYISDHEYNIEQINDAIVDFTFSDKFEAEGIQKTKCYQMIFNFDEPCEFCPRRDKSSGNNNFKEIRLSNKILSLASNSVTDTITEYDKWIVLIQDVTDEKLIQQSLSQNEKLIGIGQIVAGISHEIRSPLASMKGAQFLYKSIISHDINEDPLKTELLDIYNDMQNSIEETERIVQNLLDFSRRSQTIEHKCEVVKVIEQIIILQKNEIVKRHIVTDRSYTSKEFFVAVESDKVKSIIFNLMLNAIESMSTGDGKLSISVTNHDKSFIRVEIKDTGNGVPKGIQNKIFEPFITSGKENGTGLGLWIVKREIEAAGGQIQFFTKEKVGTTFIILLPKI